LKTLVSDWDVLNADVWCIEGLRHFQKLLIFLCGGDKDKLVRVTSQDALDGFSKTIKVVLDGREDDRNILRRVSGIFRDRSCLVAEMRYNIDKETNITPKP